MARNMLKAKIVEDSKPPSKKTDYRKERYLATIRKELETNKVPVAEVEYLLDRIGWTKMTYYARHVMPGEIDKWVQHADLHTVEAVKGEFPLVSATGKERPARQRVPRSERVEAFMLRLSHAVCEQLKDALEYHGWERHRGQYEGGKKKPYPADAAVRALLRDAVRGRRD
jgi:hypothetical protein